MTRSEPKLTVCRKCGAARQGPRLLVKPLDGCDGDPMYLSVAEWSEAVVHERLRPAGLSLLKALERKDG